MDNGNYDEALEIFKVKKRNGRKKKYAKKIKSFWFLSSLYFFFPNRGFPTHLVYYTTFHHYIYDKRNLKMQ